MRPHSIKMSNSKHIITTSTMFYNLKHSTRVIGAVVGIHIKI